MTKSARFSIIVGGLGLLVLLLVGIVAGFNLLQRSQDLRDQASVKDGVVTLSLKLPSDNRIFVNQPLVFNLLADTSGAAVDAIQLKGTITGTPITNFAFNPASDLKDLNASVVKVEGNRIEVVYTLKNADQPFIASTPTSLGWLIFSPQTPGTVKIEWDNVDSKATLYKRAVDSLKALETVSIPVFEFDQVVVPPTPSPDTVRAACEGSGGVWKQFGNSCGDSCGAQGTDIMCAQVLTYGCDCGNDACWNGLRCGTNPIRPTTRPTSSPRPTPSLKPTPDPYRCIPRPTCLDAQRPCRLAEPAVGWCPRPTPTTRPTATPTPRPPTPTVRPTPSPITPMSCVRAGCSGQLCVPAGRGDVMTTCEYRTEYACYQQATCELQANGQCGFTLTTELQSCLETGGAHGHLPPSLRPSASASPIVSASPAPNAMIVPNNYDLNGDGKVNLADLTLLVQWLRAADPQADINHDDRVNITDYSLLIQVLGAGN